VKGEGYFKDFSDEKKCNNIKTVFFVIAVLLAY